MRKLISITIFLSALGLCPHVFAADVSPAITIPDPGTKSWTNTGELSVVSTNGNSKATTTSAKEDFAYYWKRFILQFTGDALGSSNAETVTSEQYDAGEKLIWKVGGKNYAYENFSWNRNRFSGIANQYASSVGAGRYLLNSPRHNLLGEIGPGYINTEYTDQPRKDYPSARAFAGYTYKISESSNFTQNIEYLHDFDDPENYYLNTETAITAAIAEHFSLKAAYTWNRSGQPPPGFGKDDTIVSTALVINY